MPSTAASKQLLSANQQVQPDAWTILDNRHLLHSCHDAALQNQGIVWQSGQGAILTDVNGREYLDGLSGLWNVLVGHGCRELADVAAEQMAQLAYTSTYVGSSNQPAVELAHRLAQLCYPHINRFYFTTSGAEANEAAIKTARYFWKLQGQPNKTHTIARRGDYHGTTFAALSATGMEKYLKNFEPRMPGFSWVPAPSHWAADTKNPTGTHSSTGILAAKALEEEILRIGSANVAAFLAEPIVGVGGVFVPPPEYWPEVRQICDRHDVLLITDEVLTGFGRTGDWFALESYDVQPDIVTFAKGITSGYLPLGGMGVSDAIGECITNATDDQSWLHAATYSGHPVCCRVALENLALIERDQLLARSLELAGVMSEAFEPLRAHPLVKDVRGIGMLWAVELDNALRPSLGFDLLAEVRRRGLFARARGNLLHLAPCLTIEACQLQQMIQIVSDGLNAIC
ncbi:MAG: aspartate aminotransferase family protein [Pirellulales bacterium]|nr:aspartate aminotransferase family protein [Pirellulales bacterium]